MTQTLKSPESIGKEALTIPPAETQNDADLRGSLAESLVIPRESFFDRPPTPPPKDPPKAAQPTSLSKGPSETPGPPDNRSRPGTSKTIPQKGPAPSPAVTKPVDVDLRQSMANFGEIKIAATASILNGQGKGPIQSTMFTIHPLAMSPPSPVPSAIPKMPRRPARPASLRLSSFSSRTGLTTDKIVRVDSSRPGTSYSQSSQPHTGITNTTMGLRTKYGRGKYATTELVPQPSDDGEDPLVSETF